MTGLCGNSGVVHEQLALSPQAMQAGVSIGPDCGLGPGMTATLALSAIGQLDISEEDFIWVCGLPQYPKPPWNYKLTFAIGGLTIEYYGDCLFIREGKTTRVPALEELEHLEFPKPIRRLEACTTSGGLTTAAESFAGQLGTLQNKTLRYPGHLDQLKGIQRLGLLKEDPVEVNGMLVSPRDVLHALWEPLIRADDDTKDIAIIRVLASGKNAGVPSQAQVDLILHCDEESGFTAMEQGTGFLAATISEAIAFGEIQKGPVPVEKAMSGTAFVAAAWQRGFDVQLEVRKLRRVRQTRQCASRSTYHFGPGNKTPVLIPGRAWYLY
jgi:lysine 6-dehydrogenase